MEFTHSPTEPQKVITKWCSHTKVVHWLIQFTVYAVGLGQSSPLDLTNFTDLQTLRECTEACYVRFSSEWENFLVCYLFLLKISLNKLFIVVFWEWNNTSKSMMGGVQIWQDKGQNLFIKIPKQRENEPLDHWLSTSSPSAIPNLTMDAVPR